MILTLMLGVFVIAQPSFSQELSPLKFQLPNLNSSKLVAQSNKTNFKNTKQIIRLRSSGINVFLKVLPSVVKVLTSDGAGTGVFIEVDSNHLILTNHHVIAGNNEVGIQLPDDNKDKKIFLAKVVIYDEIRDLALVKLNEVKENIYPLKFAKTEINIGDDVHAIGHPLGEDWTYTRGYVSQMRKDYSWKSNYTEHHVANVIQTQTPISSGNSGGPLVNNSGELVGINTFGNTKGQGLNFSVANSSIREFLQSDSSLERVTIEVENLDYGTLITSWDDNKNGHPDVYGFDRSANGVVDMLCIDENEDTNVDSLLIDDNENGIYEAVVKFGVIFEGQEITIMYFDDDEDEKFDSQGFDIDLDGNIDHMVELD